MSNFRGDVGPNVAEANGLLKILERSPKRLKRIKFLGLLYKTHGYELRIAGGAVRDIIKGVEPQDIDFATNAHPDRSIELLRKHENLVRIIVNETSLKHGTVAIKFKEVDIDFKRVKLDEDVLEVNPDVKPIYDDEAAYEITTLRCDKFTDGRHAEVEFISDWKKDAERRDLTINSMFLTLDEGSLIDYFGGESDLKDGIVRFVGDAGLRIQEDYLRILRFFRFWSRYGRDKPPDQETQSTIKKNLEGLDRIAGERLWTEMKKILAHYPCKEAIRLMLELGVLKHIGIDTSKCFEDNYVAEVIKEMDIVENRIKMYSDTRFIDADISDGLLVKKTKDLLPVIMFACLIRDIDTCLSVHKRMKLSNVERNSILYIVENRTNDIDMKDFRYTLVIAHRDERFQTMQKIRALLIYQGRFKLLEELDSWQVPTFPITGHVAAQEFRRLKLPGKYMKRILDPLKDEWADSNYEMSREELEQKLMIKIEQLKNTLEES